MVKVPVLYPGYSKQDRDEMIRKAAILLTRIHNVKERLKSTGHEKEAMILHDFAMKIGTHDHPDLLRHDFNELCVFAGNLRRKGIISPEEERKLCMR